MIICHCNIITNERIEAAIRHALAEIPASQVTPEQVFARCAAQPNCGTCREMIRLIIEDLLEVAAEER